MRRWIFGTWSVMAVLVLAGCSAVGQTGSPTGDAGRSPGPSLSESYTDALPEVSQLLVGTLKLDGTDLAVTTQQAQELLPLWEAYRSLSTSQTAAPQETTALVTQIRQTMTEAQMTGIADMKLTSADLQTAFRGRNSQGQDQAGGTQTPGQGGFTQGGGSQTGGTRRNNGGGFAGGGFEGGGFGGGGGFFPGGGGGFAAGGAGGSSAFAPAETPNPEAIATLRAQRAGTSGANPALIGFLIQYLEQVAGVTPAPATGRTPAATSTAVPGTATPAATSTPEAASSQAATSAPTLNATPAATATPAAGGG
jgi:hypothetical protein